MSETMTIQPEWLGNESERPKCKCGAPLVKVERQVHHYLAFHGGVPRKCEAVVTFASALTGSHPLIDPCPGCNARNAPFLPQGSTSVPALACPKGCA